MKDKILIPKGCFEGYCGGCFYAKRNYRNERGEVINVSDGAIYCKKHDEISPENLQGEECYEGRIVTWIKCAVGLYIILAGLELMFTLLF